MTTATHAKLIFNQLDEAQNKIQEAINLLNSVSAEMRKDHYIERDDQNVLDTAAALKIAYKAIFPDLISWGGYADARERNSQ